MTDKEKLYPIFIGEDLIDLISRRSFGNVDAYGPKFEVFSPCCHTSLLQYLCEKQTGNKLLHIQRTIQFSDLIRLREVPLKVCFQIATDGYCGILKVMSRIGTWDRIASYLFTYIHCLHIVFSACAENFCSQARVSSPISSDQIINFLHHPWRRCKIGNHVRISSLCSFSPE